MSLWSSWVLSYKIFFFSSFYRISSTFEIETLKIKNVWIRYFSNIYKELLVGNLVLHFQAEMFRKKKLSTYTKNIIKNHNVYKLQKKEKKIKNCIMTKNFYYNNWWNFKSIMFSFWFTSKLQSILPKIILPLICPFFFGFPM